MSDAAQYSLTPVGLMSQEANAKAIVSLVSSDPGLALILAALFEILLSLICECGVRLAGLTFTRHGHRCNFCPWHDSS